MKPLDLRLCLVTAAVRPGLEQTVVAAVAGGATVVQLRDPTATGAGLYRAAVALRRALAPLGVPLIVNDRLDIALAAGAQGTHLGQSDLPPDRARAVAGPDHVIGWSADAAEMSVLAEWAPGTVDYLGVGPVWATPTKADAGAPIGIDGLRHACRLSTIPCVAIGGIDASNAGAAVAAGAAGVAVVSAICGAADPAWAANRLRVALMASSAGRARMGRSG